jgi:hypothetical protein
MARTTVTIRCTDERTFEVPAYRHGAVAVHHGIDDGGNPIPLNGWTVTHLGTGFSILTALRADREQVSNVARGLDLIVRAMGDHPTPTSFMDSDTAKAIRAYLRRLGKVGPDRLWRPKSAAGRPTRNWILEQAREAVETVKESADA